MNVILAAMFTATQLKELMQAQPFKPFRVHMSDGKSYEVVNHDSAFVKRNEIEIGLNPDEEGFSAKYVRCAILHITRIEELQPA